MLRIRWFGLILICQSATAVTLRPLIAVTGGAATSSQLGSSQTFPVVNAETDSFYSYSAHRTAQTVSYFGINAGAQMRIDENWAAQFTLGYFRQGDFLVKGGLTQGADAGSADSYYYQYLTGSQQLHAEAKLVYDYETYHPYLLFSFGPSFNSMFQFTSDVPASQALTNQFREGATTAFSFSLGLGMEFDFYETTRLGLGYRLFKLGPAATETALLDGSATEFRLQQTSPTLHLVQFYLMAFL